MAIAKQRIPDSGVRELPGAGHLGGLFYTAVRR